VLLGLDVPLPGERAVHVDASLAFQAAVMAGDWRR
jgi:hypothetical protein